MNQLVPYQPAPYQAAIPAGIIPPTAVVPGYVGTNPVLDPYGQPVYPGYDYAGGYGYRGYRGGRGYYPRKRGRFSRMIEALLLGSEQDRLRSIELQHEMGYMGAHPASYAGYAMAPGYAMSPGYSVPPYGLGARALVDDPYLPVGRGLYGRCSIPHRRGYTCPECDDYYY